jgi:3-hydroxyisobutyrate dehydrogenase-like beta-hydroxyacid dehydrogenase
MSGADAHHGMTSDVGVLGLGNMGAVLAGVLLEAGHAVAVWNRSPAKADPLARRGVNVVPSAQGLIAAAPLIVACVARYEHVREALGDLPDDGLFERTIVNLTWGSPEDARELDAWVRGLGGTYLDGGISVAPSGIGRPETELVYSGPSDAWARHAPVLRVFGGASRLIGEDIAAANVVAFAIPGIFYHLAYGGFFEAAAFAASHGIAPSALASQMRLALRLIEEMVEEGIAAIEAGDHSTEQASLRISLDAMLMCREAMERQGQQATMVKALVDVFERGIAAAHADESASAIFAMLRDGG